MTNLSLENYGVSNLETREMRAMNGGTIIPGSWVFEAVSFYYNTVVPSVEKLLYS